MRTVAVLAIFALSACDGGRRLGGNPGGGGGHPDASPRSDGSTSTDGSTSSDGGANLDASSGGQYDGGPMPDAGPCGFPPAQGSSQPCCPNLGVDACGLNLVCTALDGRTQPICYPARSRLDGQTCTADVLCMSQRCQANGTCGAAGLDFSSSTQILAYLNGKSLIESGTGFPPYPFGFSDSVNYGAATQCYAQIVLSIAGNSVESRSILGTLVGAPNSGDHGVCHHDQPSSMFSFSSTLVIQNVRDNGGCFDVDITFSSFAYQGRGRMAQDGQTVDLELFFVDQATGMRCSDGDVGSGTVRVQNMSLPGSAVQHFSVGS